MVWCAHTSKQIPIVLYWNGVVFINTGRILTIASPSFIYPFSWVMPCLNYYTMIIKDGNSHYMMMKIVLMVTTKGWLMTGQFISSLPQLAIDTHFALWYFQTILNELKAFSCMKIRIVLRFYSLFKIELYRQSIGEDIMFEKYAASRLFLTF